MSDRTHKLSHLRAEYEQLKKKETATRDEIDFLYGREDDLDAGQNERLDRQIRHAQKLERQRKDLRNEIEETMNAAIASGELVTTEHGLPGASSVRDQYARTAAGVGLRSLDVLHERMPADRQDAMEKCIRSSPSFSEYFAAHSQPAYESAWSKVMLAGEAQGLLAMDDRERAAMTNALQSRSPMAEGAGTTGGFGVPVAIDPTILMSAQGSGNPMLAYGRTVDVVTNVYKPVTSEGVSWSFDAEAEEVSDDSPTLAQPTVDVFMARGFVPFSIEVQSDYVGFQEEMALLLSEGYNELLSEKFATGNGTTEPTGILTALGANANSCVTPTTDGQFGVVDLHKVWKDVPERFRSNASWVMSVDVNERIRQFGTEQNVHAYSVALPAGAADVVFGRPVYTSSYFEDFTGTTGGANILVVSDLRAQYTIARRAGMSIELAPLLMGTTSGRPTGQRGFFSWARIGANSVVDNAGRLLQNT